MIFITMAILIKLTIIEAAKSYLRYSILSRIIKKLSFSKTLKIISFLENDIKLEKEIWRKRDRRIKRKIRNSWVRKIEIERKNYNIGRSIEQVDGIENQIWKQCK